MATVGDAVVGHVAFSRAGTDAEAGELFALGPVSVAPEVQRRSIGQALIQAGLANLRERGASGCVLIGDTRYYQRFGFVSAPHLAPAGEPADYFNGSLFRSSVPRAGLRFHEAFHEAG